MGLLLTSPNVGVASLYDHCESVSQFPEALLPSARVLEAPQVASSREGPAEMLLVELDSFLSNEALGVDDYAAGRLWGSEQGMTADAGPVRALHHCSACQ